MVVKNNDDNFKRKIYSINNKKLLYMSLYGRIVLNYKKTFSADSRMRFAGIQ
jgi:hypothetical protein